MNIIYTLELGFVWKLPRRRQRQVDGQITDLRGPAFITSSDEVLSGGPGAAASSFWTTVRRNVETWYGGGKLYGTIYGKIISN